MSAGGAVLALNPGSRSLKAAVHDAAGRRVLDLHVPRPPDDVAAAVADLAARVADAGVELTAVAHRVVHGGPRHTAPERVDDALLASLRELVPFAPLHLPAAIAAVEAARDRWPELPHVACFDTAFHAALPEAATRLPLPADAAALGVRRYGFHGLNLQHVVDTVPDLGRAVVAHLGGGCSVTALDGGRPVATSMSFSPTGGVPSATRTGDLDPDAVLFLGEHGWSVPQLRDLVNHRSGIAGLTGGVTDMQDVEARAATGDAGCRLALDVFTRAVATTAAGYTALLGGLDALVFTGGIGEHSAGVRAAVTGMLAHLGAALDPSATAPGRVSPDGARVRVLVVPADEEVVLDREARRLLGR
ncbi:acetate/propionate family kinase [Blastococcus sp. SYSU D00695]